MIITNIEKYNLKVQAPFVTSKLGSHESHLMSTKSPKNLQSKIHKPPHTSFYVCVKSVEIGSPYPLSCFLLANFYQNSQLGLARLGPLGLGMSHDFFRHPDCHAIFINYKTFIPHRRILTYSSLNSYYFH